MKIYKWLNNPISKTNGHAIIQVDPGENADIEDMLRVIDGEIGNYGIAVKLIADGEEKIKIKSIKGIKRTYPQFGFPPASILKTKTRFYDVFVYRD